MIFYLSPKDTFVLVGKYRNTANLRVTDVFYEGFSQNYDSLSLPTHPTSISLVLPSATHAEMALGYHTAAAFGDAIVGAHNWTLSFPLLFSLNSKNFVNNINDVFFNTEPLVIILTLRNIDGSEYVHFVSPIAFVREYQIQTTGGRLNINLSLSSPYTAVGFFDRPQFSVYISTANHEPEMLVRLFSLQLRQWDGSDHHVLQIPEITDVTVNLRRPINWHYTTWGFTDSFYALRAPTKISSGAVTVNGTFTIGYPFNYSDLQTVWLKSIYNASLVIKDFLTLTIIGLKATSWRQDFNADGRPNLSVEWVAFSLDVS